MQNPEDLLGFSLDGAGEFAPSKTDNSDSESPGVPAPYTRGDRFDIGHWSEPKKLITWMNHMKDAPLDAIDDEIVVRSYSAAVWLFRKAAIEGDLKATKAMETWLAWAKPIINRPKETKTVSPSKGSVAFLAREPKAE